MILISYHFKQIKKILPFIGLILLIFYIIFQLDIGQVIIAFQKIQAIYIILAVILTLPMIFIRNFSWQIILKEQKIKISFFQSLKIFLIGFFYGSFTPGFYGQLMRIPYLKEKTDEPYGKLFVNTVIETTLRTISIFFMILVGPFIIFFTMNSIISNLFSVKQLYYVLFIFYTCFLVIIFYFVNKHRGEQIFHQIIKWLIPKKFKKIMTLFINTFYNEFPRLKILAIPFIFSIITWIIVFTQEYFFVIALNLDTKIPFLAFLFLYPIANVAGFIPIPFAGVGIREIVAIEIFYTLFAVTKEEIAVIAIMGFLITDVFIGFIGFLCSLTESINTKSFRLKFTSTH